MFVQEVLEMFAYSVYLKNCAFVNHAVKNRSSISPSRLHISTEYVLRAFLALSGLNVWQFHRSKNISGNIIFNGKFFFVDCHNDVYAQT